MGTNSSKSKSASTVKDAPKSKKTMNKKKTLDKKKTVNAKQNPSFVSSTTKKGEAERQIVEPLKNAMNAVDTQLYVHSIIEAEHFKQRDVIHLLNLQIRQLEETLALLEDQIARDNLAARRFVALKREEFAMFALKKEKHHCNLMEKLEYRRGIAFGLKKEVENYNPKVPLSSNVMEAEKLMIEVRTELQDNYLAVLRRPHFNLVQANDVLEKKGITNDTVVGAMNELWMINLEECLLEDDDGFMESVGGIEQPTNRQSYRSEGSANDGSQGGPEGV